MKQLRSQSNTLIHIFILSVSCFLGIFSALLVYLMVTYTNGFHRVEMPDARYSGYLRYSDVAGLKRAEVSFESGENVLRGYVYGEENTKGLVVISHGLGFGAESYLAETIYFVDHGWRVFAYDNTGTHESEGKSTIGPSQSLLDLKAALTYIKNSAALHSLSIMVYGHSWGAYASTAILGDNFDIAAVASIAGFDSPIGLLQEQVHNLMGTVSPIVYPFLWLQQDKLFGDTVHHTATKGINSRNIPVLLIHGDNDDVISYYGASIIAHQEEITNPNIRYMPYNAENHNGHNNIFRSDAALEYTNLKNLSYKELYDRYHGEIPDHLKLEFYEGIDRFQVSEIDVGFMNMVNEFFEGQLPCLQP